MAGWAHSNDWDDGGWTESKGWESVTDDPAAAKHWEDWDDAPWNSQTTTAWEAEKP